MSDINQIKTPAITRPMTNMLGDYVEITQFGKVLTRFQAQSTRNPEKHGKWYFHIDWIDNNDMKVGIPDELFEL